MVRVEALHNRDIVLPDPTEILGDLHGEEEASPSEEVLVTPVPERLCLRQTKAHEDLIYYFTKAVVTTSVFNSCVSRHMLDEYLHPSLESFLVLEYTSKYYKWKDELENPQPKRKKRRKTTEGQQEEEEEQEGNDMSDVTTTSSATRSFTDKSRGAGKYKGCPPEAHRLMKRIWDVLKEQRQDKKDPVLVMFAAVVKARFKAKEAGKRKPNEKNVVRAVTDEEEWYAKNKLNPGTRIVPYGV